MNFIKKIFGKKTEENKYVHKATVEKIQHLFQYAKRRNMIGGISSGFTEQRIGNSISWVSEGHYVKGEIHASDTYIPPYIMWGGNPVFGFVSIIEDKVQYHYGENGESGVAICPITTDLKYIKLLDELFEHYYNKYQLPESLKEIDAIKIPSDKSDKIKFLSEYLETTDNLFFYDNFYSGTEHIVIWVDWREEDEAIINQCETIIQSGHLSFETVNADNIRGFETRITYENNTVVVSYNDVEADKDITIQTLNNLLQPKYEIRLCKESLGVDMLGFVPLTDKQWNDLEKKFGQKVADKFLKITNEMNLFS